MCQVDYKLHLTNRGSGDEVMSNATADCEYPLDDLIDIGSRRPENNTCFLGRTMVSLSHKIL